MDPELARHQAEFARENAGRVPTLSAHLSEAQLDGRACMRCGDELEPKRPVEASSVLSSQLFECVDSAACQQRALLHCFDCGCSLEGTTPVREPWYTPDPHPTGPRLCGFCYAKRIDPSTSAEP